MTVREILKMGDERLLRQAKPVTAFNTPELIQGIADMKETMIAASGAGLAAPQIGWDIQLVIFGTGQVISRYPDAAPIPFTILINPVITPIGDELQHDRREIGSGINAGSAEREGCLRAIQRVRARVMVLRRPVTQALVGPNA